MKQVKATFMLAVILVAASLLATQTAAAYVEPFPSVPKFSVSATEEGFQITVKNQDFSNDNIPVYYRLHLKYASDSNWIEVYLGYQNNNLEYTTFSYKSNDPESRLKFFDFSGKTVDFQLMRSTYREVGRQIAPPNAWIYAGSNSSWSSTQRYTFPVLPTPTPQPTSPNQNPTVTLNPTQNSIETPSQPTPNTGNPSELSEVDWTLLVTWSLLSAIIVLLVFVIFFLRKRSVSQQS